MKHRTRFLGDTNRRPMGLFLAALLGVVISLSLLGASARSLPSPGRGANSLPLGGGEGRPQVRGWGWAAAPSGTLSPSPTYTVTLPLVVRNSWTYPPWSFGVQVYDLELMTVLKTAQAGAGWVRIPLLWSRIEPVNTTPEYYQWPQDFDAGLAQLAGKNVRTILTLMGNPAWAATYPGGPIDQVDISELTQFMEAAVAHYGAPPYNVKYWEFYNEPDNGMEYFAATGEVGFFGHTPQAYVDVLAAVYEPIKAVDPEAQIVFGGLAYDAWDDPWGGPFVKVFLDGVLENGGGDYFDVMNFHYYIAFRDNWEPYGTDIIGKANYLRDKLASYGVSKPLICTETGMWSDDVHTPPGDHEIQSRYVPQVYARGWAANLDIIIWFMLTDIADLPPWEVGLLDADMDPKPAYTAYQTLARQLAAAEYVRTLDPLETGSTQVEAYEFLAKDGTTRIVVAWTTTETLTTPLSFAADQLVVVDKYGTSVTIRDGDDGVVDGQVWVDIGPSPLYVRIPH